MASKLYMLGGYTPSHAHTVMMMHNSILAVMPITLLSLASFSECGTHLDKPWFNWEGGKVPFYFNATVTNDDRVMIRHMMKQIEKKSCVRFREQTKPPSGNAPYYLLSMMCPMYLVVDQVTTWRSRCTAPPPASSRGGPGSAPRCTQSRPATSESSSTAPTSWRTSGNAGPRTGTRAWNKPWSLNGPYYGLLPV